MILRPEEQKMIIAYRKASPGIRTGVNKLLDIKNEQQAATGDNIIVFDAVAKPQS